MISVAQPTPPARIEAGGVSLALIGRGDLTFDVLGPGRTGLGRLSAS